MVVIKCSAHDKNDIHFRRGRSVRPARGANLSPPLPLPQPVQQGHWLWFEDRFHKINGLKGRRAELWYFMGWPSLIGGQHSQTNLDSNVWSGPLGWPHRAQKAEYNHYHTLPFLESYKQELVTTTISQFCMDCYPMLYGAFLLITMVTIFFNIQNIIFSTQKRRAFNAENEII